MEYNQTHFDESIPNAKKYNKAIPGMINQYNSIDNMMNKMELEDKNEIQEKDRIQKLMECMQQGLTFKECMSLKNKYSQDIQEPIRPRWMDE